MSKRIETMFREYRNKERDITLLRQRLMDMTCISDEEVIETMVFSSPEGEYVQSSGISDKTATIAMHFRDQQERLNKDMVSTHHPEDLQPGRRAPPLRLRGGAAPAETGRDCSASCKER